MNIIGDVRGKRVILLDDMVDTGGSLCHAAKALVDIGGAKDVTACATHGILSGPAVQRIQDSVLDEVIFLNTIPPKPDVRCDKIRYISVAHLFAEAISHIYMETSVSPLFLYSRDPAGRALARLVFMRWMPCFSKRTQAA